ncbi:MAG: lipase maturation factor family protein [Chthoniobacteraceae bacterium]
MPLLVFDGDCTFCRKWIARWAEITGERVDYAPYQEVAPSFPEIPITAFRSRVHLLDPNGTCSDGADAVFRALGARRRWPLWLYEHLPGFAPVSEAAYELIARHRHAAAFVTSALWGDSALAPSWTLARRIFLRSLGLVYLIAFISLWVQVDGLIGRHGILPVQSYLEAAHDRFGAQAYHLLPTLFWFDAGDFSLHLMCGAGTAVSLLLIFGVAPPLSLAILWAAYLSLSVAGQTFLSFQWDVFLLETGFFAIFVAPWRWYPRFGDSAPVPRLPLWLLRWLLFRFMLMSGIVKLTSGDESWFHLTALNFHYETQPLPTWIGWYAGHLPPSLQAASTAVMFFIELIAPIAIFGPRRLRLIGFWMLVALQGAIALTGNYNFFNLLTVALCFLLLDDTQWPRWFSTQRQLDERPASCPWWLTTPFAVLAAILTPWFLYQSFNPEAEMPRPIAALAETIAPFRTINSYGLFRVMTKTRPEIIVEGSRDGEAWHAYEFKWKPGDVSRRPRFVEPHQPRLDWQMWFAALSDYRANPWFLNFLAQLLNGSPAVLALLEDNPFPDQPPRFIRARIYDYHFTTMDEHGRTGAWWRRDELGFYCPVLSLDR